MTGFQASYPLSPTAMFAALTFVLVSLSRAVLNDGDTYIHIAAGEWMIEHGEVLTWDPFSSTFGGQPWTAHEWLSEVLFAIAYRLAGLTGIVLLTAAALATAFGNLARHVGRWCGRRDSLLLTAGALLCVLPSVLARPHLLALPVLELWVAGLLMARHQHRSPSWWMLGLMVTWANLHGGFAFGIAIAVAFAAEATVAAKAASALRKASALGFSQIDPSEIEFNPAPSIATREKEIWRWWAFVAGSMAAALTTPQNWDGLLFPIRLLQLKSLNEITEWRPADFAGNYAFQLVLLGLIAALATGRVKMPWFRLTLLLGLLQLSIAHSRHMMLFGIVGTLLLAEPVGRAVYETKQTASWIIRRSVNQRVAGRNPRERSADALAPADSAPFSPARGSSPDDCDDPSVLGTWCCWSSVALVALLRLATPIGEVDSQVTPVSAIAQLSSEMKNLPVLNSYEFGGYLALVGLHPFVDGRLELFGDQFFAAFTQMAEPTGRRLATEIDRYGIGWAILTVKDPLVSRFDELAGWRRQYADSVAVIFVRG